MLSLPLDATPRRPQRPALFAPNMRTIRRCGRRLPAVTLVYELLDAHADTADLAAELAADPAWGAHLEYLRALQREGRAALAQIALGVAV